MTSERLIEEGRKLQRPCLFLRPQGSGPVAAIWHERDDDEIESTGHHCWLTVDARHVPGTPPLVTGYISVFTDEEKGQGGRVEVMPSWPKRTGTELYAHTASVLPPIDAVFARGSEAVGEWIRSHGWERTDRYNDNFKDAAIVREYERVWHEVTCEGDLFLCVHDFCLAALDLAIGTFSVHESADGATKFYLRTHHGTLNLSRNETPSDWSEGVTSRYHHINLIFQTSPDQDIRHLSCPDS